MTKRHYLSILIILFLIALYWYWKSKSESPSIVNSTIKSNSFPQVNGRKVVGLVKGSEEEQLKDLKVSNQVSSNWKENLKNTLYLQGKKMIKDIVLKNEDSFIWIHDGIALNVESVLVSITNHSDQKTSFRVLVDSQTGKILQNWDQPVDDPLNPRAQPGLKPVYE